MEPEISVKLYRARQGVFQEISRELFRVVAFRGRYYIAYCAQVWDIGFELFAQVCRTTA